MNEKMVPRYPDENIVAPCDECDGKGVVFREHGKDLFSNSQCQKCLGTGVAGFSKRENLPERADW